VAQTGVNLARTTYLPRTDFLYQANRATRNSITGMVLPQPVVPGISGGVGINEFGSVWSSATGVMLNWEPFDFGFRGANVLAAQSTVNRSGAALEITRLQVATAAAEAFLGVLATQQSVRAALASVERARVFLEVVLARVNAGLRPGVDAERARAELAVAENQLIIAEQNAAVARVVLAQWTGLPPGVGVLEGPFLQLPPQPAPASDNLQTHPAAQEQGAAVEEVISRQRVIERSFFPRFNLQATTFARGSGVRGNLRLGGISGLGPNIANWAAGMTMFYPLFERPVLRVRQEIEMHRELVESARYDRILVDLTAQLERTKVVEDSARRIAQNTPFQLQAARALEAQATARYQAGLGTVIEVADAQRLLTQAEIDDSIARLNIWRARLAIASARGDLQPFLLQTQ
jgi:outer membrane protein TolC